MQPLRPENLSICQAAERTYAWSLEARSLLGRNDKISHSTVSFNLMKNAHALLVLTLEHYHVTQQTQGLRYYVNCDGLPVDISTGEICELPIGAAERQLEPSVN